MNRRVGSGGGASGSPYGESQGVWHRLISQAGQGCQRHFTAGWCFTSGWHFTVGSPFKPFVLQTLLYRFKGSCLVFWASLHRSTSLDILCWCSPWRLTVYSPSLPFLTVSPPFKGRQPDHPWRGLSPTRVLRTRSRNAEVTHMDAPSQQSMQCLQLDHMAMPV